MDEQVERIREALAKQGATLQDVKPLHGGACQENFRVELVVILGLTEIPKPPALALRGGLWLRCGSQELHIGVEEDFRAAKKAHPAFRVADLVALDALRDRLAAAGVPMREDAEAIPGVVRFFAEDPFGNRIEFLAAGER